MSEVENQMRPRIAQVRSMCTKECCVYLCSGAYDKGFSTSIRNQEQRTTEAKDIRITRIVGLAASLNDCEPAAHYSSFAIVVMYTHRGRWS